MRGPSPMEREFRLRLAAMEWLSSFGPEATFRYDDLKVFQFEGERVPLKDYGRGIWKPRHLDAALSFSTVYTPPRDVPPYADLEGPDGLQRYKWRGDDPRQADNVALRTAMQRRLPLIWFVGVASGSYLARYPVFLIAEEYEQRQFVVALDQAQRHLYPPLEVEISDDDRHYARSLTKQRLHQPLFRARVIAAYEQRCAMCRLHHASLLDASHILADGHALGQPIVPNGLALCKIHHAAYDQNILGVSPDLRIDVRRDILAEVDGPMLRHGIQELAGERLEVPRQRSSSPDRKRLEIRYRMFLDAA